MPAYTVTITEIPAQGRTYTVHVRASDPDAALERAITRQWGRHAVWQTQRPGEGQVLEDMQRKGFLGAWRWAARTARATVQVTARARQGPV